MTRCHGNRPMDQGGALLAVLLLLVFTQLLLVGAAHRSVLTGHRLAGHQARAAQAFEAAQSGLDWALARLNNGRSLDARCEPLDGPANGLSFREWKLGNSAEPWAAATSAPTLSTSRQSVCRHIDSGWSCQCDGLPGKVHADEVDTPTDAPSFQVETRRKGGTALVELVSHGCIGAPACGREGALPEARAQLHLTLGHLPALARMPAAGLTVRGSLRLGDDAWEVASGLTGEPTWSVHTGGEVDVDALIMPVAPGSPQSTSLFDNDPALRSRSPASLFLDLFRLDPAAWRGQPGVLRIDCASDCTTQLVEQIAAEAEPARVWLEGGLHLDHPVTIGSADRPVLLLVHGPVQVTAPVTVHGLVYAFGSRWAGGASLRVHGAVVAEGDLAGEGMTRITHEPDTLRPLLQRAGTYAPVAGSWHDF